MPGISRTAVHDPSRRAAMYGRHNAAVNMQNQRNSAAEAEARLRKMGVIGNNGQINASLLKNSPMGMQNALLAARNAQAINNGVNPLSLRHLALGEASNAPAGGQQQQQQPQDDGRGPTGFTASFGSGPLAVPGRTGGKSGNGGNRGVFSANNPFSNNV